MQDGPFKKHGEKEAAYKELCELIEEYVKIITRSEKGRLQRERMYFKNDTAQYNKRLEAEKTIEKDTVDNLIKMAVHIVHGAEQNVLAERLIGADFAQDFVAATIE